MTIKVKWFGNDSDGMTLSDFMAVTIIIAWLAITAGCLVAAVMGKLSDQMIDLYDSFMWIPLGVVGGLFGQSIVATRRRASTGDTVATSTTEIVDAVTQAITSAMSSIQTNTETTSTDTTENKEVAEDTVEDPSELK